MALLKRHGLAPGCPNVTSSHVPFGLDSILADDLLAVCRAEPETVQGRTARAILLSSCADIGGDVALLEALIRGDRHVRLQIVTTLLPPTSNPHGHPATLT